MGEMAGETKLTACAVLPAAGTGERFGTTTPKQFCKVLGRPLVSYTLECFERVKWIEHIVLVVAPENRPAVEEVIKTYRHSRVSLADGQKTRHRSIYNGIQALEKSGHRPDIVIIHDAVRPFVQPDLLEKVASAAKQHGAAGAIRPLVSTVIGTTQDGILDVSLDRSKYRASEMPQAFRYDIISTAYQKCTDYDFEYGTECLHLAQKYGGATVKLIEGDANLWKVTHKRDIYAAEGVIKEQYNRVVLAGQLSVQQLYSDLKTAMAAHCLEVIDIDGTHIDSTNYIACVFEITSQFESDDLGKTVLNLAKGRHPTMTSGIILILFEEEDTEDQRILSLKMTVQKVAGQLLPQGMYLNLVIVQPSSKSNYLQPLPTLIAETAFQRNLVFSGQTFYAHYL